MALALQNFNFVQTPQGFEKFTGDMARYQMSNFHPTYEEFQKMMSDAGKKQTALTADVQVATETARSAAINRQTDQCLVDSFDPETNVYRSDIPNMTPECISIANRFNSAHSQQYAKELTQYKKALEAHSLHLQGQMKGGIGRGLLIVATIVIVGAVVAGILANQSERLEGDTTTQAPPMGETSRVNQTNETNNPLVLAVMGVLIGAGMALIVKKIMAERRKRHSE